MQGITKHMTIWTKALHGVAALAIAGGLTAQAWAENQSDYPIDYAIPSHLATDALLLDITEAGDRLVTVGEYGHVLFSDDRGETWTQAENVPTRITLTAVHFANDQVGWAVGHDAIILHTTDGGTTWERQYIDPVLEDEIDPETGDVPTDRTLLTLYVFDESHALALGAFSQAMETFDGGVTWEDRELIVPEVSDDPYYFPEQYHLNGAFAGPDGSVFVAAEFGVVYRSLDGGVTFEELQTDYDGSFWGGLGVGDSVIVFGMRGNLWRSDDLGDTWYDVDSDTSQSLSGGTILDDGTVVIAGLGGAVTYSYDGGESFTSVTRPSRNGLAGVAANGEGRVVVIGESGIEYMPNRAEDYAPDPL